MYTLQNRKNRAYVDFMMGNETENTQMCYVSKLLHLNITSPREIHARRRPRRNAGIDNHASPLAGP